MRAAGQHQREHIPAAGTRERQKRDPNTSSFEHDSILVGNCAFVHPGVVTHFRFVAPGFSPAEPRNADVKVATPK